MSREVLYFNAWKKYMSYKDYGSLGWGTRFKDLLCPLGGGVRKYRLATSLVIWFGTHIGTSFLENTLKETTSPAVDDDYSCNTRTYASNRERILGMWAVEDSSHLISMLLNRNTSGLKPTFQDTLTIRAVLLWLVTEDGFLFVHSIYSDLKQVSPFKK